MGAVAAEVKWAVSSHRIIIENSKLLSCSSNKVVPIPLHGYDRDLVETRGAHSVSQWLTESRVGVDAMALRSCLLCMREENDSATEAGEVE